MATVLYPGSFDPLHLGHIDVIEQSVALFGKVIVGVMHNPGKPGGMFTLEQRQEMIRASISYLPSVKVMAFEGLAVDAVKQVKAAFIVKGLRTGGDFEVEQQMAHTNHAVSGVRTVYLPCKPALVSISSRFIREIAQYGGDVTSLVPARVAAELATLFPTNSKTSETP